jgi:outer membrane protein assembly factor BamB
MKAIFWKMLPAKLLHFLCSWMLILPIISSGNEVVLHKTSKKIIEQYRISYSIELKKQSMMAFKGNPVLRDRFSNKTQLDRIYQTPSAYYIGAKRWSGYPLPGEYPEVTQLEWEIQEKQRFRHAQDHLSNSLDKGANFREDLFHLPETTISWEKDYSYGALPPLVDLVKGKQWLFSSSMDGRLTAFIASTGRVVWDFQFPLGEFVQNTMASFVHKDRLIISAGTNSGNVYFFLGETGTVFFKINLGSPLNAPLHYFTSEEMTALIAVGKKELICIDLDSRAEKWRNTLSEEINLSPFSLQVGSQRYIFTGSTQGNIHAISLNGKSVWKKNLDASKLTYLSGFVKQGKPYIAGISMSKSVFLLHAVNGDLMARKKIPAPPRSRLSVDAESFSFALAVADPEDANMSLMISDHFFSEDKVAGQVAIPGNRFLGPIGVKLDGETFYYLIDQQWQLWMIQKGSRRAVKGYPFPLSLQAGAVYPYQTGGMVLTEYALFAACPGKGLIAVGIPENIILEKSFNELNSHQRSQSNYRNDLELLPSEEKLRLHSVSLSTPDKQRILPKPSIHFFPKSRDFLLVTTTPEGDLIFRDEEGIQRHYLKLSAGKMYVAPILQFIRDDEARIFLLSEKALQAWSWNVQTQRVVRLWERRDLYSKGSTFIQTEHDSGSTLYFVDERKHLTAVASDSGDTLFRELVDCYQFVYYPIYAQHYLFCGSKKVDARSGKLLSRSYIAGSHSSIVSLAGKTYLFQSDELDMIAWDAHKNEQIWRVRRLICKQYCFQRPAPAILHKAYGAWAYWTDYHRLVCIDVLSGFISWRASLRDDYALSSPTIAETASEIAVFLGSVRGKIFAFYAKSGQSFRAYPILLPGKEAPEEAMKGCSTPVLINASLLVYRLETGLVQLGRVAPNNRDFETIRFQVMDEKYKFSKVIFNRAELFWNQKMYFSNIVQD